VADRLDPIKEAAAVQALRESLAAMGAGDDEQLVLDTIEGETGLFEAIDKLLLRMADSQVMVCGVEAVVAALEERKARFMKRIETDRALIEQAMMVADLEKIERPTATLSLVRRPATRRLPVQCAPSLTVRSELT
jgi:hypothetical protein